jgi:hypothetical protein
MGRAFFTDRQRQVTTLDSKAHILEQGGGFLGRQWQATVNLKIAYAEIVKALHRAFEVGL